MLTFSRGQHCFGAKTKELKKRLSAALFFQNIFPAYYALCCGVLKVSVDADGERIIQVAKKRTEVY